METTKETEGFKELRRQAKKLNDLLADPQPGTASWCMAYGETMKWIVNYWQNN